MTCKSQNTFRYDNESAVDGMDSVGEGCRTST